MSHKSKELLAKEASMAKRKMTKIYPKMTKIYPKMTTIHPVEKTKTKSTLRKMNRPEPKSFSKKKRFHARELSIDDKGVRRTKVTKRTLRKAANRGESRR